MTHDPIRIRILYFSVDTCKTTFNIFIKFKTKQNFFFVGVLLKPFPFNKQLCQSTFIPPTCFQLALLMQRDGDPSLEQGLLLFSSPQAKNI